MGELQGLGGLEEKKERGWWACFACLPACLPVCLPAWKLTTTCLRIHTYMDYNTQTYTHTCMHSCIHTLTYIHA